MSDDLESSPTERLGFVSQLKLLASGGSAYWLVNVVNFTDGIAYFGILNILILYLTRDLGVADTKASWFMMVFTGLVALLMVPGGWISDRVGTRNAISLALTIGSLGRAGLWIAGGIPPSSGQLLAGVSLLVMACSTGILQPALYAGVKETSDNRVATMGFSLLYAIMNLGVMFGDFASPYIRTDHGLNWGFRGVVGCITVLTLLQLVFHLVFFPKLKGSTEQVDLGPAAAAVGSLPAESGKPLLDPKFLYFIFILLPVRTLFAHQFYTVPDYIFRCFGKDISDHYEQIIAINSIVVTVGVPLLAFATARVSVLRLMIAGTAVSALSTFLLSLPPEGSRLITYVVIFSVGEALWSSRFLEYVAALAPPGRVGAYMGVANLPWFLAKFTTGIYSGAMLAKYIPKAGVQDPTSLWTMYGIIACISPLGLLLAYPWLRAADKEKTN